MAVNQKPWGTTEVLLDQSDYKVKKIFVKAGERFSLQYHNHRQEHWVIISGIAYITQYGVESTIRPGEHAYIPKESIHRLCAGIDGTTFIEIQRGECREDDIVRLEDDYGRAT